MPSNQQRREAERLRLQRQLEQRRERETARRRATLITSIVGTLVLVAAVITIIAVYTNGGSAPAAGGNAQFHTSTSSAPTGGGTPTPQQPSTPTSSSAPSVPPTAPAKACAKPAKSSTVKFAGVTVKGATDLKKAVTLTSHSSRTAKALQCRDLVVGKGKAATANSTVTVQYTGALYKNGKVFDSSWSRGQATSFPLSGVVPGFKEGIGGVGKVAPMRVGGRRIMILPPALAYGSAGSGPIPPNSTLVFVVDLVTVSG